MRKFTEEEMGKIIEQFCEREEREAPQEVQEAWSAMDAAFDNYRATVSNDQFKKGFLYALKLAEEKKI